MHQRSSFKILLLLFLLSVLVRVPNLNRPLSKHHEFNVAFFLIPLEIWSESGAQNHGHLPPYNYFNPGDLFVPEPIAVAAGEKDGRYYYLSLPPLSYIAPYYFFKSAGLSTSVLNLQIFNLILHGFVLFFLVNTLNIFFSKNNALFACTLYLFAPGPLWYHGNAYTHHVFALLPLIMTVYFFIRYTQSFDFKGKHLFAFALSLFALIYAEWIGVFLAIIIFALAIFNFRSARYKHVAVVVFLVGLSSLTILLYQYVSFMGWERYKAYLLDRFIERAGLESSIGFLGFLIKWAYWCLVSYGLWIPALVAALFVRWKSLMTANEKLALILIIVPLLIYQVVFREFAYVHEYSVLYQGFLWSFLSAMFLEKVDWKSLPIVPKLKFLSHFRPKLVISVLSILFVAQYYVINRPGKVGQNGDRYDQLEEIGATISQNTTPDETVFLLIRDESISRVNPQIVFYAKRNFKPISDLNEIAAFLEIQKNDNAVVFEIVDGAIVGFSNYILSE